MSTREQTATRLLAASLRKQYEPAVDIDWEAPLDPDRFWLPPRRSSLYGTTFLGHVDAPAAGGAHQA